MPSPRPRVRGGRGCRLHRSACPSAKPALCGGPPPLVLKLLLLSWLEGAESSASEPFLGTGCRMRLPILGSVLRGAQTQFTETEAQNGGPTGVGWNPSEQACLGPPVSEQKMPAGVPGEGGGLVSGPTPSAVPNIRPPRPCISHHPASVPGLSARWRGSTQRVLGRAAATASTVVDRDQLSSSSQACGHLELCATLANCARPCFSRS